MHKRTWHIFIFSLLFSLLLWVSVNLNGKFQLTVEIRLEPINLPQGKSLLEPLPSKVSVKFFGTGWLLAALYFDPNFFFELDLSNIKSGSVISLKDQISSGIKKPLNINIAAIEIQPDSLQVSFDNYSEKKVPVISQIDISCKTGYGVVGSIHLSPDSIIIGGATKKLKEINFWKTGFVKYSNIKDDIVTFLRLSDTLNQIISLSENVVRAEANIQILAEQKFSGVEVKLEGVPNDIMITIIPPTVDLIFRSGVDYLVTIEKSQIKALLRYDKILKSTTGFVSPDYFFPPGLRILQATPSQFEYVIRKTK